MATRTKEIRRNLGIYYTPEIVVDLIFAILNVWKEHEDKNAGRWNKRRHYPSVIDPACGEGIFLKKAIETGFTKPKFVWGIDIDSEAIERWKDINLFQMFNSKSKPELHFFCRNGLIPLNDDIKFRHKRGGLKEFDAVVGNPPYGGVGVGNIDEELENALLNYEIWKRAIQKDNNNNQSELGLTGIRQKLKSSVKERLKKFPIEVLFIDRFIQLSKEDGWIAIIIPDGILANSNFNYVRKYISEKAKVEAIISLPRNTFKDVGTSAKTSILLLKKVDMNGKDYPVFLASLDNLKEKNIYKIIEFYKKFYETNRTIA